MGCNVFEKMYDDNQGNTHTEGNEIMTTILVNKSNGWIEINRELSQKDGALFARYMNKIHPVNQMKNDPYYLWSITV